MYACLHLWWCVSACVYACGGACGLMYACLHLWWCVSVCVSMPVVVFVCICMRAFTCVCVCVCVHADGVGWTGDACVTFVLMITTYLKALFTLLQ
jgi:hypothetical protein